MNQEVKPSLPPYQQHIFVCIGDKCSLSEGAAVYDHLKDKLRKDPALRNVMRSKTTCLGVCKGGPISVVYPEGVWYSHMTKEKIDRIINDHLKQGLPVQDWVFYPDQKNA